MVFVHYELRKSLPVGSPGRVRFIKVYAFEANAFQPRVPVTLFTVLGRAESLGTSALNRWSKTYTTYRISGIKVAPAVSRLRSLGFFSDLFKDAPKTREAPALRIGVVERPIVIEHPPERLRNELKVGIAAAADRLLIESCVFRWHIRNCGHTRRIRLVRVQ